MIDSHLTILTCTPLQRRVRFSARLAGFCRGRCHQRRARRAEEASFSVLVSNLDFRVPRLRQRGGAECGVFVRSAGELDRARSAVQLSELPFKTLDENVETTSGYVCISTMHLAKGLEFRAVVVMACDDEIIPLQERIATVGDDADLQEVYDTERHLLYVACTRARDHLFVTSVAPASEFLDDLRA